MMRVRLQSPGADPALRGHAVRFVSNFLLPVTLIVAAAVASVCGVLVWLTNEQDRLQVVRELEAARFAVDQQVDFVETLTFDYAVWDEAARRVVLAFDEAWIDDNIGVYVHEEHNFQYVFVVGPDGRPVYAFEDGAHLGSADPERLLGPGYAAALRRVLEAPPGDAVSGFTATPRGTAIFSISDIRSSTGDVTIAPNQRRALVMARLVDAKLVGEIGRTALGLKLRLAPPAASVAGVLPITTYDGKTAATLRWVPQKPGTSDRQRTIPWIALLAACLGALGTLVVRKSRCAVRELMSSEARARHLAHHDALTGLPNRRAFTDHLLALSRLGGDYAILYMDLDGFKEVNDSFGHGAGDALLNRTGARLLRAKPPGGFLARLGGDEFAFVLANLRVDELEALAERIVAAVREPHELGGQPVVVGASIGIALSGGAEYEDVVRRADIAMYAAKNRGRDGWCLFDASLDDGRRDRKLLEGELRKAVANGDISLVFQPIVRVSDGEITAVEALARWTHPTRGPISPDVFVPVAEETGAIVELGRYVLREACLAARDWPFNLAVNLSPAQFWDRTLVDGVLATLEECSFPPGRLEFEITETYLLRRPEAAAEVIASLRKHGIKIALDDFGMGYASIGYLKRFELDLVKLDRSFVEHVATNSDAAEVAQAVIALGGALKLPILAEGVETAAQSDVLAIAGCAFMQGWHYGHPVPAREIDSRLGRLRRRTAE